MLVLKWKSIVAPLRLEIEWLIEILLLVCVDVYTSEIETNCKEITLLNSIADTTNIGTFTFHDVPIGTKIKACVFDSTLNASVDDCELTSTHQQRNQK
jgi:hypothetical protein